MPRGPAIILPAANGINVSDDPVLTPLTQAQQVSGFVANRTGVLIGTPALLDTLNDPAAVADGIAYYYGQSFFSGTDVFGRSVTKKQPDAGGDRRLHITGGALYASAYQGLATTGFGAASTPPYPPKFQAAQTVVMTNMGTFATGQPLRSCQFETEQILLQVGASSNYRYYQSVNTTTGPGPAGTLRYQGLATPAKPSLSYTAPSAGNVAKVGLITYAIAYIDEFGRYSSPSLPVSGDFVTNNAKDGTISTTLAANIIGVAQIAFLGTIQGAPTSYYVLQDPVTGAAAIQTYTGAGTYTWEDGVPDATVATGLTGPLAGANDAPNLASWAAVWKDRVIMNDLLDPNALQVSNQGSPTQFSALAYNPNNPLPTLGLRLTVDQDNGNPLMAGVGFGTVFALLKRRNLFILFGDDASNFTIQPVYDGVGCIATDTAIRCGGTILFLGADGVYSWSGGQPECVSTPISRYLLSYNLTPSGAANYAGAKAAYCNREYTLWIGQDIYVYSFDTGQWTTLAFGADANQFLTLWTAGVINPLDPRSAPPMAALAGIVTAPQSVAAPNASPNSNPSSGMVGPIPISGSV